MPKENQNKSIYDKVPGLKGANKGQGSEQGSVKTALRSLGFEGQQQALTPQPQKPGPVSPVKNKAIRDILSNHLVATGRSNGEPTTSDKTLGGKRTTESDKKRDQHAKKVLFGMESATQENQRNTPKELRGSDVPLTHAVSGHGPESDQIGRLLNGRRADEKAPEGSTTSTLTGNKQLGDYKAVSNGLVGDTASNTSGAFLDHFSMLRVANEAFAQAGMVDRYAEREGKGKTTVHQERFATTISHTKGKGGTQRDPVGYNLEVQGHSKQSSDIPLAKDEMEQRFKSIKRDDTQHNATVVMDPSYNAKGQRVGWNLQTAYANTNTPSEVYTKPSDVGGKSHEKIARVETLKKLVARLKPEFETKTNELGAAKSLFNGKNSAVSGKTKGMPGKESALKKAKEALANNTEEDKKAKLEENVVLAQQALDKYVEELEQAKKDQASAQLELTKAQDAFDKIDPEYKKAVSDLKVAEQAVKDMKGKKDPSATDDEEGGGGSRTPGAGYDPIKGIWTGERPEKPAEYTELKGIDKDGKPLTAHHLYPWNKIMADLNAALLSKDKSGLERIFSFGGVTVDPDFWVELKKDPAQRNYAFAETLNLNMGKICWSPSNVMMGPGARKDDPGEEVDTKYGANGWATPQSALAELFQRQGGIQKGGGLANYMLNAMRQGGVGEADKYDAKDWGYEGGKPFLKGPNVSEKGGKRVDERSKWVFGPNPKHAENEKNIPVKDRTLTGQAPQLVSPTRDKNKAHFEVKDNKAKKNEKAKKK